MSSTSKLGAAHGRVRGARPDRTSLRIRAGDLDRGKRILVTGGAGFIGSAVVRMLVRGGEHSVVTFDKLTYAASLDSLEEVIDAPGHQLIEADLVDARTLRSVFERFQPNAVIHLAAETHVDRSIDDPSRFVQSNVNGTFTLLQESLRHWRTLPPALAQEFRLVHVSTDEVFGELGPTGRFTEQSPYAPRSPYSASKAASDQLVRAWFHTYGLPALITHSSNNLGPYQFPDKLIPLTILRALAGNPIPLYGDGEHVRDWLHVDDHARALLAALERGVPGESYLIGAHGERSNRDVVGRICSLLDEMRPHPSLGDRRKLITYVPDRPGHDRRYAIDPSKAMRELHWRPRESVESALRATVAWYLDHRQWCDRVQRDRYDGGRLGLGRTA